MVKPQIIVKQLGAADLGTALAHRVACDRTETCLGPFPSHFPRTQLHSKMDNSIQFLSTGYDISAVLHLVSDVHRATYNHHTHLGPACLLSDAS